MKKKLKSLQELWRYDSLNFEREIATNMASRMRKWTTSHRNFIILRPFHAELLTSRYDFFTLLRMHDSA